MQQAVAKFHILRVIVSHGSDRYDIGIFSENQPCVADLLTEMEKKSRVPKSYIQIIFKGQKLHTNPAGILSTYGIFNGSKLLMVGEKLGVNQDAIFRRILGVSKDVDLIARSLSEVTGEFSGIETGGYETKKLVDYLPKLNERVYGMKQDLSTFLRIIEELKIDAVQLADIKQHQLDTMNKIKGHIKSCESLMQRISRIKINN